MCFSTSQTTFFSTYNGELVFGIPQIGMVDNAGNYMENNELQPDYQISLNPSKVSKGEDEQIGKAVEVLLNEVGVE